MVEQLSSKLRRYDIEYYDGQNCIAPDENGDYVRYEDAQAEIELLKRNSAWQSKEIDSQVEEIQRLRNDLQELTCGDPKLVSGADPLRDALLKMAMTSRASEVTLTGTECAVIGWEIARLNRERRAHEPSPPIVCRQCGSTDTMPWPSTESGAPRGEAGNRASPLISPLIGRHGSWCTCETCRRDRGVAEAAEKSSEPHRLAICPWHGTYPEAQGCKLCQIATSQRTGADA